MGRYGWWGSRGGWVEVMGFQQWVGRGSRDGRGPGGVG